VRERQLDHKPCATAGRTFSARAPAVHRDQLAHHGETDAAAARCRLGLSIQSYVRFPHAVSVFVRNAGTLILDCEQGNVFVVDLNANITTLTVNNWPTSGTKGSIELWLKADGTARTVALGSFKSPGGATYTPTSTLNKYDVITLHTFDAGTNVFFLIAAQNL